MHSHASSLSLAPLAPLALEGARAPGGPRLATAPRASSRTWSRASTRASTRRCARAGARRPFCLHREVHGFLHVPLVSWDCVTARGAQWRVECSSGGSENADEGGVGDGAKCMQIERAGHVSAVFQVRRPCRVAPVHLLRSSRARLSGRCHWRLF